VQSKKNIRITSLFYSVIVFAIGILIGFWLSRNISVPVLALRDAANKVGEGALTQRVISTSHDEIGELGVAFNRMVDDLAIARRQVEDRTKDLILEKKKSDELLEDLKKTLANLKENQDQLIRQEKLASIGQLTKGIVDRLLNPLNYINNFSSLSKDLLDEVAADLEKVKPDIDENLHDDITDVLLAKANLDKINEHGVSASRIVKGMEKLLQEKSDEFILTDINALKQAT